MFHSNLKLSNYCVSQIKSYPKFYQNLIQLWADVSEEEPKDVSEICEEIIWNNCMISSNCQTLFTSYNGSGLNGTATSGLEGRVPQLQKAFCFLLFWILSRPFPSIFF